MVLLKFCKARIALHHSSCIQRLPSKGAMRDGLSQTPSCLDILFLSDVVLCSALNLPNNWPQNLMPHLLLFPDSEQHLSQLRLWRTGGHCICLSDKERRELDPLESWERNCIWWSPEELTFTPALLWNELSPTFMSGKVCHFPPAFVFFWVSTSDKNRKLPAFVFIAIYVPYVYFLSK